MTCADVEQVLPELMDGAPDNAFQTAFQNHLKSCPDCSDLVSDLTLISESSRQLADTEDPAPRLWVRIAAELRAEGIIREPETVAVLPARRPRRWSPWLLAPVAAALIAAGAYVVNQKPISPVAVQKAPAAIQPQPTSSIPNEVPNQIATAEPEQAAVAPQPSSQPPAQAIAEAQAPDSSSPKAVAINAKVPAHIVEPGPSAEDQQFLSVVSTQAPSMKASYQRQLQMVNADIQEIQSYLKENPGDADARQQLMDAFQQKALLYQIALDRIQ